MADPTTTPTTTSDDFATQLAKALALVAGGIGGRALANSQGNPLTSAVPPQLTQMLDMANQRYAYQNPLYQATTQGAYDMLPDFAKNGTALSGTLSNAVPAAPPTPTTPGGPGLKTAGTLGALSALAALLGKGGASSGGDLSKIFDAIKKRFGQHPAVQGNKPNAGGIYDPNGLNPLNNDFTGWQGNDGRDPNQWDPFTPDPTPNVDTNEFMAQWPETSDPFAPFDPNQFGGGGGGVDDPEWNP